MDGVLNKRKKTPVSVKRESSIRKVNEKNKSIVVEESKKLPPKIKITRDKNKSIIFNRK